MPGCGETELGPMTWTMPCLPVGHVEQVQAEVLHVAVHVRRHVLGHRIGVGARLVGRRDDVIERAERRSGMRTFELGVRQHLEGLRRRDLVDQVQADEELGLAGRQRSGPVWASHTLSSSVRAMALPPRGAIRRREGVSCTRRTV
jgi:hypothetical protein